LGGVHSAAGADDPLDGGHGLSPAAAVWDEQLSEGKALSDREEAVLRALEIMTRNGDGAMWLKVSELREQVAKAEPTDKLIAINAKNAQSRTDYHPRQ